MDLNKNDSLTETFRSEINRSRRARIISITVLLILVVVFTIWRSIGVNSMKMQWTESNLTITDPSDHSYVLSLNDLEELSYISAWKFGHCIEGDEDRYYRYGIWENDDIGTYHLYASKSCSSVILLKTSSDTIAISYESDKVTKDLFENLGPMLEDIGYHPEINSQN